MTIEYYVGVDGPSIEGVSSPQELLEALDAIHTLALDGGLDQYALDVLSVAIDNMLTHYDDITI